MHTDTIITAGKGGVGKTTIATAIALYGSSTGKKTGLIDFDGGHSITNTLLLPEIASNSIFDVTENLSIAVIDPTKYEDILSVKRSKGSVEQYLAQFPGHLGIVPFADMANAFFGLPTDTPGAQKFAMLVSVMIEMRRRDFHRILIDVEPTAGFQQLLNRAGSTARSLKNLQGRGVRFLSSLHWPDVTSYLKGDYIRNINDYTKELIEAVELIKEACYVLVCTPEAGPVNQTFTVRTIIENFGGKVKGCVVNNVRNESHETVPITHLGKHEIPVVLVQNVRDLHSVDPDLRKGILLGMGSKVHQSLL